MHTIIMFGKNTESSESRSLRISKVTFFILLAAIAVVVFLLFRPFIVSILLAAITSGLAAPLRDKLQARFKGRKALSASLATLIVVIALVVPFLGIMYFALIELIDTLAGILEDISSFQAGVDKIIRRVSRTLPFLGGLSSRNIISSEAVANYIETEAGRIMEGASNFVSTLANFFLMFFVYLYTLFFFIKDGPDIRKGLSSVIPLPVKEKEAIINDFVKVTRSSLKGIIVIGVLQGLIGGLLFFIMGLPSPIIFGIFFLLLAAIPNFGAILVWLPTGIILLFSGEIVKGLILLTIGALFIAMVDYVIRPRIIRHGTKVHEVLVLVGILGGIPIFGVFGFIIGPIIMAVFKEVVTIFSSRYHDEINQI